MAPQPPCLLDLFLWPMSKSFYIHTQKNIITNLHSYFRGVPLTVYDSEGIAIIHRTAIFSENVLKWLGTGLKGQAPAVVNSWTGMFAGLISTSYLGIVGTISRFGSMFFFFNLSPSCSLKSTLKVSQALQR